MSARGIHPPFIHNPPPTLTETPSIRVAAHESYPLASLALSHTRDRADPPPLPVGYVCRSPNVHTGDVVLHALVKQEVRDLVVLHVVLGLPSLGRSRGR